MFTDLIYVLMEVVDEDGLSPDAHLAWERVKAWRPAQIVVSDEEMEMIEKIREEHRGG